MTSNTTIVASVSIFLVPLGFLFFVCLFGDASPPCLRENFFAIIIMEPCSKDPLEYICIFVFQLFYSGGVSRTYVSCVYSVLLVQKQSPTLHQAIPSNLTGRSCSRTALAGFSRRFVLGVSWNPSHSTTHSHSFQTAGSLVYQVYTLLL